MAAEPQLSLPAAGTETAALRRAAIATAVWFEIPAALLLFNLGVWHWSIIWTEMLINALVKARKRFMMMAYPNRSHGIFEGENTTIHLYDLLTHYLEEHLPPGPAAR